MGSEVDFAISHNASGLNYCGLLDPSWQRIAGNLRGSSGFTPGHVREISERAGRRGPIRLLAERC